MTNEEALIRLASSTAEAVEGVLQMYIGDAVERGPANVVPDGVSPFDSIVCPAVGTNVAYVDGVRGGNVFVVTALGARRLAALMMGEEPPEGGETELTELEVSAVGEAMNQMMAAAAGATSSVLGQEVDISAPQTRFFPSQETAIEAFELSAYATTTAFIIAGEPARLVQLVPNTFVVRLTKAFANLAAEISDDHVPDPSSIIQPESIRNVPVRVWAELGRFRMGVGQAVSMPPGSVVELDALAEDSLDLVVNGHVLGRGRLLVTAEGEWALRIEEMTVSPNVVAV